MKYKIALILPYFGEWPKWINLYLKSCSLNPFIDFHFFSDCGYPQKTYNNTFFHEISWDNYQNLISNKLGITYQRNNAYALCDVKPFYGFIHKELLQNYDFWGFGDLDVCYGDLSKFINNKLLKSKDVISTHADRISGHFALFRNNEYFRNICFSIANWKEKLESKDMFGIDEHYLTELIIPGIKNIHRAHRYIFSKYKDYRVGYQILIWPINLFTRISFKEYYTTPAPKIGEKWIFDLSNGRIIDPNAREIPYLHFLFFKKNPFYKATHHWESDFYNVSDEEILYKKGSIVFNSTSIKYIKND